MPWVTRDCRADEGSKRASEGEGEGSSSLAGRPARLRRELTEPVLVGLMQGFLQGAKARAAELVAEAEAAAKGLVETVAPTEGSVAVVVPIAHGGPTGLQFVGASDMPGEPVFLDWIAPGSPVSASHPQVKEGSRLVAINMVRRSMVTCAWVQPAVPCGADASHLLPPVARSALCSFAQVPIDELPLSAVRQMLQHKEDTHQDFSLTLVPPAGSWLPDTDALLESASTALDTARLSASVALEKTRSSGFVGALDALRLSGGNREGAPQPGVAAGGATDSGAWAQVSLDGPSRLGSLSDVNDTTGRMSAPPAVVPEPAPVDYSAYYSSSAASMVQQTAQPAAAASSVGLPAGAHSRSAGAHGADVSAGLDAMFSSSCTHSATA